MISPTDGKEFKNAQRIVDQFSRTLRKTFNGETIRRFDPLSIERLSQVVAAFEEAVIMSVKSLQESSKETGERTQLEHIILTFPQARLDLG